MSVLTLARLGEGQQAGYAPFVKPNSQHFAYVSLFDLQSNPVGYGLLYLHFTGEDIKVQREVICC